LDRYLGSTTFYSQGHPRGNDPEGDSAGGPDPERAFPGWPTLAVETGVSEPLSELHRDMRWWFSASGHQVKIILLVKFGDQGRPEILIEKWEEERQATREGATTTRQAAALQPILRQSIAITRYTTTNPASYHVTSGALVLSFRLLFLPDPQNPQERDITISVPRLKIFAGNVWRSVQN
jgi:hypothetical protein